MQVEVEALPGHGNTQTIDEIWTVSSANGTDVAIINDAIAIHILVLDVTRLDGAESLRGGVANVVIVLEQSEGNQATHLTDAVTMLILVGIDIILLVVFSNLVLRQLAVLQIVAVIGLTIQGHLAYIGVLHIVSLNTDVLALWQMDSDAMEVGRAQCVLVRARTNRIEPHGRKDIPRRCLTVVLITTIAIGSYVLGKSSSSWQAAKSMADSLFSH